MVSHAYPTLRPGGKLIFLLRHAKAESEPHPGFVPGRATDKGRDHARPLAASGLQEAHRLGLAWKKTLPWPDRIQCSNAVRTRETLRQLLNGAGEGADAPSEWLESALYHATPGTLLERVQQLDSETRSVLLIGHNPTIHQTAAMACRPAAFATVPGKWLMQNYPPCTLTVLQLPEGMAWNEAAPACLDLWGIHTAQDGWMPCEAVTEAHVLAEAD